MTICYMLVVWCVFFRHLGQHFMCILPLYEIEVAEVNNMLPFINLFLVQKWKVTGALIVCTVCRVQEGLLNTEETWFIYSLIFKTKEENKVLFEKNIV